MSRSIMEIPISQPKEFVDLIVNDFFYKEGFKAKFNKGENVWQKGSGWITAPQFIKVGYREGFVLIEAWIKLAILPGVYGRDMDLNGVYGFAIKQSLKNKLNDLAMLLSQQVAAPAQTQTVTQEGTAVPASAPIPVAVHNPTGKATAGLILGILSLLSVFVPFLVLYLTIILSIPGIVSSVTGMKSSAKGRAVTGLVLSILSLVISSGLYIITVTDIIAKIN